MPDLLSVLEWSFPVLVGTVVVRTVQIWTRRNPSASARAQVSAAVAIAFLIAGGMWARLYETHFVDRPARLRRETPALVGELRQLARDIATFEAEQRRQRLAEPAADTAAAPNSAAEEGRLRLTRQISRSLAYAARFGERLRRVQSGLQERGLRDALSNERVPISRRPEISADYVNMTINEGGSLAP